MRIIQSLTSIIRKIISNIFYGLLTSLILSIISTNITLKFDFVEQILTKLLKIFDLEYLMTPRIISVLFFFLFFLIIFRRVNKNIKKSFYFKKHGGISWSIDKETGIVSDELYCSRHRIRLLRKGVDEYYCQKCRITRRKTKGELRRLYNEVNNLAEKKAR